MKFRFILALLATAAVPPAMMAADQNIGVNANVAKFCALSNPVLNGDQNIGSYSLGSGASTVNVKSATDAGGVLTVPTGFTLTLSATCNYANRVSMASLNQGLKDPSHAPGPALSPFVKTIHYSAHVTWDSAAPTTLITTIASSAGPSLGPGPHIGDLTISVGFIAEPAPLLAGSYTDTLTVSLEPQL